MSSKYPSSRKSDVNGDGANDPINSFSLGFKTGFEDLDRILRNMFRAASSFEENMRSSNSVYYGYQVAVGPDGKPHVREFGNIWQTNNGMDELRSREPFVESLLDEKENVLKIVVEMPGLRKEDIQLEVTKDTLSIKAQNGSRKFDTNVPLSAEVDASSTKATYNNGILEVKLGLKSPPKPRGFNVKVD